MLVGCQRRPVLAILLSGALKSPLYKTPMVYIGQSGIGSDTQYDWLS